MEVTKTKINENGRIVIPAAMRAELGMQTGEEVLLRVEAGEIRIYTLRHAVARARQLVRGHASAGESWSEELIQSRRAEAAREEASGGQRTPRAAAPRSR